LPGLETTKTYEWYTSHAVKECLAGAQDLRAMGRGRVFLQCPWAGTDVHPLNEPITQRLNQLSFNQEIKSLQKPLDKETHGLSLSEIPPMCMGAFLLLFLSA
jgi:hypothetical protein